MPCHLSIIGTSPKEDPLRLSRVSDAALSVAMFAFDPWLPIWCPGQAVAIRRDAASPPRTFPAWRWNYPVRFVTVSRRRLARRSPRLNCETHAKAIGFAATAEANAGWEGSFRGGGEA